MLLTAEAAQLTPPPTLGGAWGTVLKMRVRETGKGEESGPEHVEGWKYGRLGVEAAD